MKPPTMPDDAATRPFCVFYVHMAMSKAILADTVMALDADDARRITIEKHQQCLILHVRIVGTDDGSNDLPPVTGNDHIPPLKGLPGARFINGEFHAASCHDESELDALSD